MRNHEANHVVVSFLRGPQHQEDSACCARLCPRVHEQFDDPHVSVQYCEQTFGNSILALIGVQSVEIFLPYSLYRQLSYAQALKNVGCQCVEAIVRQPRLHFAGGVARQSEDRLPKANDVRFPRGEGEGLGAMGTALDGLPRG